MEPARSVLFIPGNRESWVANAHENDADVIILDLEDSVPPDEKEAARKTVAKYLPKLHAKGQRVHVRVNAHPNASKGFAEHDFEAIACEQLEAVTVPKVQEPNDIERLDTVLTHIERREGLPVGGIELTVSIETAQAMRQVYDLCEAADRVGTIGCGAVKGTDTNRALGFEWTGPGREGLETLHLREQALMDARAAEIEFPLAGTYIDVDDIEGLRKDMQFSQEMGYTGYLVIHPSHVEHANEIFLPDTETIEYWVGAMETLLEAENEGKSAVRYEGDMIDIANIETARRYIEYAEAFADDLNVEFSSVDFSEIRSH
ncbi:HpcH/HpaI aldolase/citrate lyase family protein [Halalkalicoccus jeotgali]|uniref:Citrate lyase beta chain n=1 Tax=Halalkalicoccus jeotgali (strain DSM 18796 / CECT 7217 / JCM 14584 / KCTC 4019 / B3) TaxID=795797 RepID=D8JCV0_HALJB|nr:CoA ester lyase [Halalkalicoccus jeotgali]ADJ16845.1 putative citrate lyase beta chain [Halalkalicoccus jeotgali B3]ELY38719.1 putative citrate lyase beta chain [Halalkalicoccus jeotgali B3]